MRAAFRLVAIVLSMILGGSALAAMNTAKVAAAKKAGDDFIALTTGSETSGKMPRQTDPKTKALLDAVFDRSAFGSTVLPIGESRVAELLNNANRVGFAYMLAGTELKTVEKLGEDPKALERAEQNIKEFAPEIGRWFDYQMVVQVTLADSTIAFLASAKKEVLERPQVNSGLNDVRSGIAGSLRGLLQTMSSDTLDDNWRRDRLPILLELAPKAAKLVTAEDAESLKDDATRLADGLSNPRLQLDLKKFAATIAAGASR